MKDIIVIGAGPAGLSCAIEAKKQGFSCLVIDRGTLANSIYHFPQNMTFFSTAELMEIGDIPFIISGEKPKRVDALKYYWHTAKHFKLELKLHTEVLDINKMEELFMIKTDKGYFEARHVIFATGYYDNPNSLGAQGEDLPNVSHYYSNPHKYIQEKVIIIGANNSAVEAALELFRYGVDVTLIHRGDGLSKGIKYWVLPDIQNRIENKEIPAMFETTVQEIKEKSITVSQKGQILEIAADSVLALTGYHPDFNFIKNSGVNIDSETLIPQFNPDTGETNIPGIYIAGALQAGKNANKIFIENGRLHGKIIVDSIREKSGKEEKSACEITCLDDGAYRVTGDFVIKDGTGKDFDLSGRKAISLCRCGEAKNKPFCDGTHKEFFQSKIEARILPPPAK